MPALKPENLRMGGRADARVTVVPDSSVPTQVSSSSLMLKTRMPASKSENLRMGGRADARVTAVPDSSVPRQGLSCSLMLKTGVPASNAENSGFGGRADARELACQPHELKMLRPSRLQTAVDLSRRSTKGPTSCSTTDAVTARDFAQLTPRRARQL